MAFVKLDTGEEITEAQVRQLHPNVSFGLPLSNSAIEVLGVKPVEVSAPPEAGEFERVEKDGIEEVDGVWREKYVVVSDYPEYIDPDSGEVITTEQQTTALKALQVREARNIQLASTDKYALVDMTLSEAMRTYRQALRDVPAQSGFPLNVVWPERPTE